MSTLFFKRFVQKPLVVAAVVPSSPMMINKVAGKMDFSKPRTVVELGPGEGCHSRELAKRMDENSKLLLFEIDGELCKHLQRQFADDPRVEVINQDAERLKDELTSRGLESCDYVLSGIPFSILPADKKRRILDGTHQSLCDDGRFIIYQVTNELKRFATQFPKTESEYFLLNIPPMFVTVYHKNGNGTKEAPVS